MEGSRARTVERFGAPSARMLGRSASESLAWLAIFPFPSFSLRRLPWREQAQPPSQSVGCCDSPQFRPPDARRERNPMLSQRLPLLLSEESKEEMGIKPFPEWKE